MRARSHDLAFEKAHGIPWASIAFSVAMGLTQARLSFYFLRQDVHIGLSEYSQMQEAVKLSECQIDPPYGGILPVI